jgi:hypothetical protein
MDKKPGLVVIPAPVIVLFIYRPRCTFVAFAAFAAFAVFVLTI